MLLSNTGWHSNINDIGLHMVDPGYPVKPQRRAIPLDAAQLERLVGRYKFGDNVKGWSVGMAISF